MWLKEQIGRQVVVQLKDRQYVMVQPPGVPVTFDDGSGPAVATTPAIPGKLISAENDSLVIEYRDGSWPQGASMLVLIPMDTVLTVTSFKENRVLA